ncbi:MAG: sigma-54-dependent Fis family transcriptional regulator [Acidithiobacillus sp.]|nr:sigma-54-dependent Fis family transcriptional regulator [Acidithiobacillus sp.]
MNAKGLQILVVDDEPDIRSTLADILDDEGYGVGQAASAEEAERLLQNDVFDLILLDIWMPGEDGLQFLQRLAQSGLEQPVLMMSGHGSIEAAVQATKLGAYDFIEKPLSLDKTLLSVSHALEAFRLQRENRQLREHSGVVQRPSGNSSVIVQLRDQLKKVAAVDSWALLLGEPGTGKEVAARYLHGQSRRSQGPFVDLRAAAIAQPNVTVELFGSEQEGRVVRGRLEMAHRGTLFIDEIADMNLESQARLISALQERRILRIGGTTPVAVDVRVIAASARDLQQAVAQGQFRQDLFYRLNALPLRLPTLAQRVEDIPTLVEEFMVGHSLREGLARREFLPEALEVLRHYPWPGNVRELQNLVERLLILSEGPQVTAEEVEGALGLDQRLSLMHSVSEEDFGGTLKRARERFERAFLEYHLARNDWNIARTAEMVGLERTHLYRKLKSLGIALRTDRRGDGELED